MSETKKRRQPDLRVYYSRRERDIMYWRSAHQGGKANAGWLHAWFTARIFSDKTAIEELKARGFDITTLRFSICKVAGQEGCRECWQWPHTETCSRGEKK